MSFSWCFVVVCTFQSPIGWALELLRLVHIHRTSEIKWRTNSIRLLSSIRFVSIHSIWCDIWECNEKRKYNLCSYIHKSVRNDRNANTLRYLSIDSQPTKAECGGREFLSLSPSSPVPPVGNRAEGNNDAFKLQKKRLETISVECKAWKRSRSNNDNEKKSYQILKWTRWNEINVYEAQWRAMLDDGISALLLYASSAKPVKLWLRCTICISSILIN